MARAAGALSTLGELFASSAVVGKRHCSVCPGQSASGRTNGFVQLEGCLLGRLIGPSLSLLRRASEGAPA